jgi:surface polysaccharide O-acyltransferase-like enzyme
MTTNTRLHYLDWLRVLAFGLLIFYHTGMLYVTWSFHVKSPRIVPGVEWAMILTNPWRLALLFFISGVASRFLLGKLGPGRFARDRLTRLLPTLVFGMLMIVPPQTYFELVRGGRWSGGYLEFWFQHYLVADRTVGVIVPTWNHLWFLPYLLVYCLAFAVVSAAWSRRPAVECPLVLLVLGPGIWMAVANVLARELRPDTHALLDDWAGHLRWIGVFVAGLLAARCGSFWDLLRRRRRVVAGLALVSGGVLLGVRVLIHAGTIGERWDGPSYAIASGVFGWTAILAIVGMASHHLRSPSPVLSYLNVAVLPVYMLHQTVLILLAVAVFRRGLPLWLEGGLIAMATLGISLAIYEAAIRRWSPLRFLFGLKRERATAHSDRNACIGSTRAARRAGT